MRACSPIMMVISHEGPRKVFNSPYKMRFNFYGVETGIFQALVSTSKDFNCVYPLRVEIWHGIQIHFNAS